MSKPIYPIITDTHLKIENISLVVDIFKQFIDLAKSLGLKKCFHLGDFFTSRSSQSLVCLLVAKDIFDLFEREKIELVIIPGNHDKVSLVDEKSYLSVVANNRKYVTLIEKQDYIVDEENEIIFYLLPYFKEGTEYLERLAELLDHEFSFDYRKVLLTHASINGVRNNDGSMVDGDIEQDFLEFFDLVLSGHYHNRSYVTDWIVYIGSGYQANYGEDESKGFTLLKDDLKLEFIQSKFPIYKKVIIDIEDDVKAKKILSKYSDTKDNIRIIFKGDQEQIDNFDANKFMSNGISVKFENIVDRGVLFSEVQEANMMTFDKKNVMKNYILYTRQQDFTPKQTQEGMKILSEIQF